MPVSNMTGIFVFSTALNPSLTSYRLKKQKKTQVYWH